MATRTCALCNKNDNSGSATACAACDSISYCSPQCEETDRALHSTICTSLTSSTPASRPSPAHKLALLFPVDSTTPQLIWVHCERHVDEDDGVAWELAETRGLLAAEKAQGKLDASYGEAREYKSVTRNARRGYGLSHTLQVVCRDAFLMDGSSPNVCIKHVTKGEREREREREGKGKGDSRGATHDWRGPVVVLRQPGTAMDPGRYEDVRGGDLRVAVDYFVAY